MRYHRYADINTERDLARMRDMQQRASDTLGPSWLQRFERLSQMRETLEYKLNDLSIDCVDAEFELTPQFFVLAAPYEQKLDRAKAFIARMRAEATARGFTPRDLRILANPREAEDEAYGYDADW